MEQAAVAGVPRHETVPFLGLRRLERADFDLWSLHARSHRVAAGVIDLLYRLYGPDALISFHDIETLAQQARGHVLDDLVVIRARALVRAVPVRRVDEIRLLWHRAPFHIPELDLIQI